MRKVEFQNGEYYHIYNKGAAAQNIFREEKDFMKFIYKMGDHNNVLRADVQKAIASRSVGRSVSSSLNPSTPSVQKTLGVQNPKKLVKFICYSLAPNHYHFIVKQLEEHGISKFMHKLEMGYAKYYNRKYKKQGALFQGKFQAVHIDNNEYLLWLSGYANGNIEIHKIAEAEKWSWSSYRDYLGLRNGKLCNKEIILSQFTDTGGVRRLLERQVSEYKKYVKIVIENSSKRKDDIKKYFLE